MSTNKMARANNYGSSPALPTVHRPQQNTKNRLDKNQSCLKHETTRKQVGCVRGSGDCQSQGDVNMNKQMNTVGLDQVEGSQVKVNRDNKPADQVEGSQVKVNRVNKPADQVEGSQVKVNRDNKPADQVEGSQVKVNRVNKPADQVEGSQVKVNRDNKHADGNSLNENAKDIVEKVQKEVKVRAASSPFVKAKTQMKKLVHHKTRKIKVLEPVDGTVVTSECRININKTKTSRGSLVETNSDKLRSQAEVNRHRKTDMKDKPTEKKTRENQIDKNASNAELLALKESTFTVADDCSSLDEVQNMKTEKPNYMISVEETATCDKHNACVKINSQEKDELNTGSARSMTKNLPKQGTFLIEKPKLAWSSPVLSSRGSTKKIHDVDSSYLASNQTQTATAVTSLHSIHSDINDACRSSTAIQQNLSQAATTSRLQTYSDPVLESYFNFCVDSGEDTDGDTEDVNTLDVDTQNDNEIIHNGTNDDQENNRDYFQNYKPTMAINCSDSLSWVLAKSGEDVSKANRKSKKLSKKENVNPSENASAGYNNDIKQVKPHKLSRIKQLKKNFAKLPKELSDNLYNMLPSSSRFIRHRDTRENRMDKTNQVTVNKESPTVTKLTNDQASPAINKVLMRHATTLTSKEI